MGSNRAMRPLVQLKAEEKAEPRRIPGRLARGSGADGRPSFLLVSGRILQARGLGPRC